MPRDVDQDHEIGADLSLDDFGTGHSSLAYLQRQDRSVLRARRHAARGRSSCGQLSRLHTIWMEVVAEGAETDSDAVEHQLGCEYAQGFAFGEPMTSDAARDLLVDKPSRLRALKIASE